MRKCHILFALLIGFCVISNATAQIDYTKLIVGRSIGTHTFDDGTQTRLFGFSESLGAPVAIPGPTIQINSGDSVKIDFWNVSQGAPHTIHLHGLDVDQQNDGVPMLSFEVHHMEHGYYYFKAPHPGTYLYHCHVGSSIHLQAGMYGMIIVRPTNGNPLLNWDGGETYDREFSLFATEIDTTWHNDTILDQEHDMMNPTPLYVPEKYEPQYFLINGKNGTQLTDPANFLFALKNEKVYMRLTNLGYYGARYTFPSGVGARTVASDGRPLPTEVLENTIEVLPGERYECFIQLGTDQFYTVGVEHFDLNTQVISSSQNVTIQTSALDVDKLIESELIIYPNPSEGIFHLSGAHINAAYSVFSPDGKMIYENSSTVLDLSAFASGIYYLKFKEKTYLLNKY